MESILLEFVSKTLNKDKDGVAELLKSDDGNIKDDALKVLLDLDKDRVKDLKKTSFDDGVKKTQKGLMTDFEKQLKEKFELDSDLQGLELIDALIENQKPSDNKKANKDLTWDDIKKRPDFIEYEKGWKKSLEDKQKEFDDSLKAKDTEYKKKETRSSIQKQIIDLIDNEIKPSLSSDPVKAAKQKQVIVEDILKMNPELQGDSIIFLKDDGSRLEDDHGHLVDFKLKVKDVTNSYYDIPVATDRSSAGNGKDEKKESTKISVPKNKEEYISLIKDQSIPVADRTKIMQEFQGKFN